MKHFKRFQNWLGYIYCACLAFGQRLAASYRANKQAAEAALGESATTDIAVAESAAALEAQPSTRRSKAVGQTEAEAVTPIEQSAAAQVVEEVVGEVAAPAKDVAAPVAEPKLATPVKSGATTPRKTVAAKPPTVREPGQKAPQTTPKNGKPQGTKATTPLVGAPDAKYNPGTVNDQTAQRLARLLVSEIKLYHTSKNGGPNATEANNIYDLLKDPIEKSRQHYKRRMGAEALKTMPDYFHSELVRSLCAGDASRLGPNYQAAGDGV
jgi:hypothetical protein